MDVCGPDLGADGDASVGGDLCGGLLSEVGVGVVHDCSLDDDESSVGGVDDGVLGDGEGNPLVDLDLVDDDDGDVGDGLVSGDLVDRLGDDPGLSGVSSDVDVEGVGCDCSVEGGGELGEAGDSGGVVDVVGSAESCEVSLGVAGDGGGSADDVEVCSADIDCRIGGGGDGQGSGDVEDSGDDDLGDLLGSLCAVIDVCGGDVDGRTGGDGDGTTDVGGSVDPECAGDVEVAFGHECRSLDDVEAGRDGDGSQSGDAHGRVLVAVLCGLSSCNGECSSLHGGSGDVEDGSLDGFLHGFAGVLGVGDVDALVDDGGAELELGVTGGDGLSGGDLSVDHGETGELRVGGVGDDCKVVEVAVEGDGGTGDHDDGLVLDDGVVLSGGLGLEGRGGSEDDCSDSVCRSVDVVGCGDCPVPDDCESTVDEEPGLVLAVDEVLGVVVDDCSVPSDLDGSVDDDGGVVVDIKGCPVVGRVGLEAVDRQFHSLIDGEGSSSSDGEGSTVVDHEIVVDNDGVVVGELRVLVDDTTNVSDVVGGIGLLGGDRYGDHTEREGQNGHNGQDFPCFSVLFCCYHRNICFEFPKRR